MSRVLYQYGNCAIKEFNCAEMWLLRGQQAEASPPHFFRALFIPGDLRMPGMRKRGVHSPALHLPLRRRGAVPELRNVHSSFTVPSAPGSDETSRPSFPADYGIAIPSSRDGRTRWEPTDGAGHRRSPPSHCRPGRQGDHPTRARARCRGPSVRTGGFRCRSSPAPRVSLASWPNRSSRATRPWRLGTGPPGRRDPASSPPR